VLTASSLRPPSASRCLGGDTRTGPGGPGRGTPSALAGSGHGWDGRVVRLVGGVPSWGGWLGGCGVCAGVGREE
jgi:hypothetical protein